MTTETKRILVVLTSHDRLGDTGKKTGFYLSEVSHPYAVFARAGYAVDFVSPKGGRAPLDGLDLTDAANRAFLDDGRVRAQLEATLRPSEVDPSRYAAVYYAGGHGTMWDLPGETELARIAAAIYERGGVVAAVCHGPAGLVNLRLADGAYLVAGKTVSAFTNEEEEAVGLTGVVPFLLESTLAERGARITKAPKWQAHVAVSERLVTGQNPASAAGVAERMRELLEAVGSA
jgi:putative intracellular protease/amidase